MMFVKIEIIFARKFWLSILKKKNDKGLPGQFQGQWVRFSLPIGKLKSIFFICFP